MAGPACSRRNEREAEKTPSCWIFTSAKRSKDGLGWIVWLIQTFKLCKHVFEYNIWGTFCAWEHVLMHSPQCCEFCPAVPVKRCLKLSGFNSARVVFSLTSTVYLLNHIIPCRKHIVCFCFHIILELYNAMKCNCLCLRETGTL